MTLRPVVIDFETTFGKIDPPATHPHLDNNYSLSIMTTEAYVRDPRFQAHGAAIKWKPDLDPIWYEERRLRQVLKDEDWSDVFLIAWHAHFDGLILAHHYGVQPKMWCCPMSMARHLLPPHESVSLDNVRKLHGLPGKVTPYQFFRDRYWDEITSDVQEQIGEGACDEVESIWKLFLHFGKQFPQEEYEVLDEVIRMFVDPALQADVPLLRQIWSEENDAKYRRMVDIAVDIGLVDSVDRFVNFLPEQHQNEILAAVEAQLQSAPKFTQLLLAEGIEVEQKQGKNGPIPAFAKTDDFMRDLLEHENERVRTLAEARLGAKSTLMQTRAENWGWMASRGSLCVYLKYCGAATLRPTGGDSSNFLNMKRQSQLRRTLKAPPRHKLGPVDASQIECRVLNYLAGQQDMVEKFARGEDPYVGIASHFYGERIYKAAKDDPRAAEMEAKRGMGKQGELMCGYGASGSQFKITAKNGLYGPPVDMSIEDATRFVKTYRDTHPFVCDRNFGYWSQAERMLPQLAERRSLQWGPLHVHDGYLYLPNGCRMDYTHLEFHRPDGDEEVRDFERDGYWRVRTRRGWKKMWGSKLVQNICEAVSRVIVSQAMIRIRHMGIRTLNWPYDELLLLIPQDGREQQVLQACIDEVRRPVPWLPGLPLDAEGHLGERYTK